MMNNKSNTNTNTNTNTKTNTKTKENILYLSASSCYKNNNSQTQIHKNSFGNCSNYINYHSIKNENQL